MSTEQVIDCSREAIRMALLLGGPILLVALVVGLLIGLIQTMTQMHEPVVAMIPRLMAVLVAGMVSLPWLVSRWIAFAVELIGSIPERM